MLITRIYGWCLPAGKQVHSKEIRSKNMAAIKGKDTMPAMPDRKFVITIRKAIFR